MIERIASIKNVGRFHNFQSAPSQTFGKFTVIFGNNGSGKTTITATLRSLQSGNADLLMGRRTLTSGGLPEVTLSASGDEFTFSGEAWSEQLADLEIFDDTFVHKNIYSGDVIARDQRVNLYHVVLGEEGVELAEELAARDEELKEMTKEVRRRREAVQAHLVGLNVDADDFLALQPDDAIEKKLAEAQSRLAATGSAQEIRDKRPFDKLTLPEWPTGVDELLSKTLDGLSRDAEARVHTHFEKCLKKPGGEAWVVTGLEFGNGKVCPFCGQPVEKNELLRAYRTYFAEAYRTLKKDVARQHDKLSQTFGEQALLDLQTRIGHNKTMQDFWNRFFNPQMDLPDLSFESLQRAAVQVREKGAALLNQKSAQPLESLPLDDGTQKALQEYQLVKALADRYNHAVNAANVAVSRLKEQTATADASAIQAEIRRLKAIHLRQQKDVAAACSAYGDGCRQKSVIDHKRGQLKVRLDEYTKGVFFKYPKKINEILKVFGAQFQIRDFKRAPVGGTPSAVFALEIQGTPVAQGGEKSGENVTSFRNTLSTGDRRTLALAFFLAKLEDNPRQSEKIVVFDDPITGQDSFRGQRTADWILKYAEVAKQVIVLSHNKLFLKFLLGKANRGEVKTLHLAMQGPESRLEEWVEEGK